MQYRTYKLQELTNSYTWTFKNTTYTNLDTLVFATGGAVADYNIDEDYMVANNSDISLAQPSEAVAGQIIALINDTGIYALGVITSVDNEKLKITFRSMLTLFDKEVLNPLRHIQYGTDHDETGNYHLLYDAVEGTAEILSRLFCKTDVDRHRRLPLIITADGGGAFNSSSSSFLNPRLGKYEVPALWTEKELTFNPYNWLIELFNSSNVVLKFDLVFDVNYAYISLVVTHPETSQGRSDVKVIKSNMKDMKVEHTEERSASATVCSILDEYTKDELCVLYLTSDNGVTSDPNDSRRVQPYKLTAVSRDTEAYPNTGSSYYDDYSYDMATSALCYNDLNHYIRISVQKNSPLNGLDLRVGDRVELVLELDEHTGISPSAELTYPTDDYSDRVWKSVYTGRKEKGTSNVVTLIFGKIRVNYTDLIQMRSYKNVRE